MFNYSIPSLVSFFLLSLGALSGLFLFFKAVLASKSEVLENVAAKTLWRLFIVGIIGGLILSRF